MGRSAAAAALSGKGGRGGLWRQKRRLSAAIGTFSAAESHASRAAMSQKNFRRELAGLWMTAAALQRLAF